MFPKLVYLCGPIQGCSDYEAWDWREKVKGWGKRNSALKFLDPMRRDYRGKENDLCEEIIKMDKADIAAASIVLVNYPSDKQAFIGSSMEILYAFERGKIVVVVAPKDVPISPWMKYHSHFILDDFESARKLISSLH